MRFLRKRIIWIIFLFYVTLITNTFADNIYVDPILSGDCTSNNYSISNQNCTGSDGDAYTTIQAAINAMNGGDDVFIRGGTYNEGSIKIPLNKDGTAEDYSSIQSYPNEWAILDGAGGAESYTIGFTCYDKNGTNQHHYWKFEKLEIMNGNNEGLFISGGPFLIRYCYFHDNIASGGGANPGAIKGMIWHDSIIEYNFFEDNGNLSGTENGNHIAIHSDYSYSHGWDWRANGVYNINHATRNNTIRYNYFVDNDNVARAAYRHKSKQTLTPICTSPGDTGTTLANPIMTYQDYGDKIHHNIVVNSDIQVDQDFAQVYNNIVINGGLKSGHNRKASAVKSVFYNNTVMGSYIGVEYNDRNNPNNPGNSLGETIPVWWYVFNNIIDNTDQTPYRNHISIAVEGVINIVIDMNRNDIDRNYIYRPITSRRSGDHFMIGQRTSDNPSLSANDFNTAYSKHNYMKQSSESTDSLYMDTTGTDMYKTRGTHSLNGTSTIMDGGIGGGHPYLSSVGIPTYVGATDPNNNNWVNGVLSLSNTETLKIGSPGDPGWLDADWVDPGDGPVTSASTTEENGGCFLSNVL